MYKKNNGIKKTNVLVCILLFTIAFSSFSFAYAISGFQTYNKIDVTGSSDACVGIAILPITNYVSMACNSGTTTITYRVSQYNGTSIATSSLVISSANDIRKMECFSVTDDIFICGGSLASGATGLRRITVTSSSTISTSDFTNPAVIANKFSQSGTDLYAAATNGNFYRVSMTTFTQTGVWTGLTTGSPTCTDIRYATSIATNIGIALCDTNTLVTFSYDESSGSGAVTKISSANLVGTWSGATAPIKIVYDGSSYAYILSDFVDMESIGLDINGNFTTASIQYAIRALDFKGGAGGYWVVVTSNDQIYLLKKQGLTPPNNLVAVQTITHNVGAEQTRLSTHNSEDYVISKGSQGNSTVFFLQALVLHNENDNPIILIPSQTGSIDCDNPANVNILICRIVSQTGGNIGGLGGILDTGVFSLFVNSGLIDGSDTDPKTNGVGFFIMSTTLALMTGIFFVATKGRLREVPTFIWVITSIALIGGLTVIGWVDPTILIVSIIVIVAISAMQIRNSITSGMDFSRGEF